MRPAACRRGGGRSRVGRGGHLRVHLAILATAVGCTGKGPDDGSASDTPGDTEVDTVVVDSEPVDSDSDGADSDAVDSDTDVAVVAACVLGWGETEAHPLRPGDEVPVIRGLQGRWHVPGAVSCTGIDPGRSFEELDREFGDEGVEPAVRWRILTPELAFLGGYPADASQPPLYRPMKTDAGPALLNERLLIWTGTYEEAVDRDAVMSFELTDAHGVHVEASVAVRLVDPAAGDTDTDVSVDTDTDAAPP